jgi:hypothetical protein
MHRGNHPDLPNEGLAGIERPLRTSIGSLEYNSEKQARGVKLKVGVMMPNVQVREFPMLSIETIRWVYRRNQYWFFSGIAGHVNRIGKVFST